MLARELLSMPQEEFSVAFKGSLMKRAKLHGLKRNAAVVPGNVGTEEDVPSPDTAIADPESFVRVPRCERYELARQSPLN